MIYPFLLIFIICLVLFIISYNKWWNDTWGEVQIVTFQVGIVSMISILLIELATCFGGGFSKNYETVNTEEYSLINYEVLQVENTDDVIIDYQTEKGSFELNNDESDDKKIKIITPENGTPKYVTITEDKYFNYLTLFSEIRTTYTFTVK